MARKPPKNQLDAIFNRCYNCSYLLSSLTECEIEDCILHPFRMGYNEYKGVDKKDLPKNYKTPSSAIKNYCLHRCCNHDRVERENCPIVECPLYSFRSNKARREEDE